MLHFWGFLLSRINCVSKKLQKQELDVLTVHQLFDSLIELVSETRQEKEFDSYERRALEYSVVKEYERNLKRGKERKIFFDESPHEETVHKARDNFRINVFYSALDNLIIPANSASY